MVDFGYDISDYERIHYEYGTLADFDKLIARCRQLDIKLILDFVPNHTSDDHEWFIKSAQNDPEYKDFYIWHPGVTLANGTITPPSNWISVFRYSAWTWNRYRQEYYLHQFAERQPDLNYRNPKVVAAMEDVLRLWLGRGVSGFRVDAVPYLFESEVDETTGTYPDEPLSNAANCDSQSNCYLTHTHTMDQNETYDLVYSWRKVLDDWTSRYGGEER